MTSETANLNVPTPSSLSFAATPATAAFRLTNVETAEVLDFLGERPPYTFIMSGFIRDNGIESELNRGTFYGCREASGKLAGVSLLGHAIYVETRSDAALRAFAAVPQTVPVPHVILGEQETVSRFWNHYAAGRVPRYVRREILLQLKHVTADCAAMTGLRSAQIDELDQIASVHAALAFEESAIDPLTTNREAFLTRCRRRISQGRTFVLFEHNELVFKLDVISDTPEVIYVEGLYVNPKHRGKGLAAKCLAQICRTLLRRTKSITALVNEEKRGAMAFVERIGFAQRALYETIFLEAEAK